MYEICANTLLEGTFMCAPSFLVCTCLTACVRARTRAQLRPFLRDFGTVYISYVYVTQSMKRYQVLVHSFARNQLERRSGSIFCQNIFICSSEWHIFV